MTLGPEHRMGSTGLRAGPALPQRDPVYVFISQGPHRMALIAVHPQLASPTSHDR